MTEPVTADHPKKYKPLKNPYYRMGAIAILVVFALMHWAHNCIDSTPPEELRRTLFFGAVAGSAVLALTAIFFGERFRRRLNRLAFGRLKPDSRLAPDEFSSLNQRVTGMARDLEDRIGELEREKTRLDAMLRSMQEGLIVIAENRSILLINPAAARILGVSTGRVIGFSLLETARNADLEALVSEAFASDSGASRQIRFFRPDERHLLVNIAPYRDIAGERQAVLVFHDVTEIHRLENLRREFVANVSHELKTPLTSLQGFIETLLSGAWQRPEHAPRFLSMMADDANRLSRLIHDLLDLSKIESGGGGPEKREPVQPADLIRRALTGLSALTAQKKLIIQNHVPSDGPQVEGDPGQLEQVFVNLLENAVKFTPEGGSVRIQSSSQAEGQLRLRFEITDTGLGIPESALTRVFERFYRVDPARSREVGGTGLGLSIVKHIVEQHGGSVGVSSPGPGLGSTFYFTLPVR